MLKTKYFKRIFQFGIFSISILIFLSCGQGYKILSYNVDNVDRIDIYGLDLNFIKENNYSINSLKGIDSSYLTKTIYDEVVFYQVSENIKQLKSTNDLIPRVTILCEIVLLDGEKLELIFHKYGRVTWNGFDYKPSQELIQIITKHLPEGWALPVMQGKK